MRVCTVFTKIQPQKQNQHKRRPNTSVFLCVFLLSLCSGSVCGVKHWGLTRHLRLCPSFCPSDQLQRCRVSSRSKLYLNKIFLLALARAVLWAGVASERQLWTVFSLYCLYFLALTRPFPPVQDSGHYSQCRHSHKDHHRNHTCKAEEEVKVTEGQRTEGGLSLLIFYTW